MSYKKVLLSLFLTAFILISYAQKKMNNYEKQWKKIDSLISKSGLLKSALNEVNAIFSAAKKENNDVQVIKALLYRMRLNDQLSEQGKYENIALLEAESANAKEPARSILHSITASSYLHYLQLNRWQFYNRSSTINFKKDDLATWSIDDLYKKISSLYEASLSQPSLLKTTLLEQYDPIIIKGNARQLRPTLFDLLAHQALAFFRNEETSVTKPAYAFEIGDQEAFAAAHQFIGHRFSTKDTASLHFKALKIYRDLIDFHLNDKSPDALIDVDIERISFANQFSTHPEKTALYAAALERIIRSYPNNLTATGAVYLLAEWHSSAARSYDPLGDTTKRYAYLKAVALCRTALAIRGEAEGKSNCETLLREILKKEIRLEAEKVNAINKPFRMLVNYRNLVKPYFRLVKLDKTIRQKLGNNAWDKNYWQSILALPAMRKFSYSVPDTKDHQSHRVEIKIDALAAGEYAVIASTDENFALKDNSLAVQLFYVSDIAYVNSGNKYYIVNRNSGAPLSGAQVQLWRQQYDYNRNTNILLKDRLYRSAATGYVELEEELNKPVQFSYKLEIIYGNDKLFMDDELYSFVYREYSEDDDIKSQAFLFTDRSIYRPGQTVYFKGIVIRPKTKNAAPEIITNRKSTVRLLNTNGEIVDSVEVATNSYGSYSGKFTLPSGMLNGDFNIQDSDNNGSSNIKVEEYKRPKFFVDIPKPSGTFRLEDSVRIELTAKSFAGNNINGASVSYRVKRRTIMPMWRYSYSSRIWPPYRNSSVEITHGVATTDENGRTVIMFNAVPDRTVPRDQNPVFYYEITADVTDLNGETRSGTTSVAVGYHVMKIDLPIPESVHADSLRSLKLTTTNLNDVFEKAEVAVTVYSLDKPARTFRERYWQQPDQFIMSREQYYAYFPLDMYADENDKTKWARNKKLFDKKIVTAQDSSYSLGNTRFNPGWYVVEAVATDRYNQQVKELRYFEIKNDEKENIRYADNGEIPGSRVYVKNNRVYVVSVATGDSSVMKDLKISYTSFRDKTLPGSNETWKIKISGAKGDRAAAEILTAMYDASLDQFNPHSWTVPYIWRQGKNWSQWSGHNNFTSVQSMNRDFENRPVTTVAKIYDRLKINENIHAPVDLESRIYGAKSAVPAAARETAMKVQNDSAAGYEGAKEEEQSEDGATAAQQSPGVQPRKNFNETAFFFPQINTDAEGNAGFSFTTPEALTEWKWMVLAHTKDLSFAYGQKTVITQKELMVQPNAPRFLRQGDLISLSSKIANLSQKKISGTATLQLIDPLTGKTVNAKFGNIKEVSFTSLPGQSTPVTFDVKVPSDYTDPVTWRIMATSADGLFNDGEESLLPVVSNRILVTETLPLFVRGNSSRTFSFEKLIKSGASTTLKHEALTFEYSTNPAWYAVQSLPYLTEGPAENAEQVFSRYYANAIASKIAGSSPRISGIAGKWRNTDTAALLSQLQKNAELKSVLLQETPWVLEAKTESQQKKNIALLFDMTRMSADLRISLDKLQSMQLPSGGFPWYPGGREDRYMTQHILSGIGHLKKLGALPQHHRLNLIIRAGVAYLDLQLRKEYEEWKKVNGKRPAGSISYLPVQYLYMRSFFTEIPVPADVSEAYQYYRNESQKTWIDHNPYLRAMIALSLFRTGEKQTAEKIMAALKETAITHAELGMYWKDLTGGYYWYQAAVESQSLLIEAFTEIRNDLASADAMKTWLLKNKQTNSWKTTRATADACYALLLQGSDWLNQEPAVQVSLGNKTIKSDNKNTEAGTGYFQTSIKAEEIKPSMGNVRVKVISSNKNSTSWGAVYWQYFENLDKITPAATPLQLSKKLFIEKNTDRGPVLEPLRQNSSLKVGDKIRVRIELRVDRAMEYVHMKDMRASCMEPVNVTSSYKWQDGLGYYESTKDVSTNFFFDVLPKGVYVFEYPLFVSHEGRFSNGITSIQCMYAPEFSSHSEGVTVNVK